MTERRETKSWSQTTRRLLCCAALGFAWAGLADQLDAAEIIVLPAVGQEDASLDSATYQPGFALYSADEDLQEQIAELSKQFAAADWATAFRLLTDLKDEQLKVLAPIGGTGQYALVKQQLQRHLLSLPPDGRRAFRLYFDGQAAEQLEKIKSHPLPGSNEQLALTQALVDRLLASSVGGEAAELLGDMYFERGMFDQADRNWRLAIEEGSATGQAALTLQAKRALALKRAGRTPEAQALLANLKARYNATTIKAGGLEVDAIAMLSQSLGQAATEQASSENPAKSVELLPAHDATPAWHLRFLHKSNQKTVNQLSNQGNYYRPPVDLIKFVPPVVSDEQSVYFHWLGTVFAMDRQTGKVLWQAGKIKETAESVSTRTQTNQGDPRNYRIALSDEVLLVTTTPNNDQTGLFVLKAYDKETGLMRWSSNSREDWSLGEPDNPQKSATTLLGQVMVHEGTAYAVVSRSGQNTLHLRRFNPANGQVEWTIPLGGAEVLNFQYTQVRRLPQPTLVMGRSLLYVMTNNGALIAVDMISNEVRWALRMTPPLGIVKNTSSRFGRANQLSSQINAQCNTNGSGQLLLQDSTLYVKEHNGKTLYALDPSTGQVNWSAGNLKPDAKLVAIDDERFYLMDRALQSYEIQGNHDLITQNGAQTGRPDHAGAIPLGDNILIYGDRTLRLLDKASLDPAGKYENAEYLGSKGGHLYQLDDLLIAIDTSQITAFKISNDKNN